MSTDNSVGITSSGLPINDTSAGTFSAVQLTTKGDMLVHNGANYIRLAVGSDGEVFMADSAQATGHDWGALTFVGDLVPISKSEASSSASIAFTGLDFSTYSSLWINMVDVHPVTDNVQLRVLFSTDGGASYLSSGYDWCYRTFDASTGSGNENHATSSTYTEIVDNVGNGMGEGTAGWFWILPSDDPTQTRQTMLWEVMCNSNNSDLLGQWGGCQNSTTSTIDAIKFEFSSGNIETGTFYLYGYNAA